MPTPEEDQDLRKAYEANRERIEREDRARFQAPRFQTPEQAPSSPEFLRAPTRTPIPPLVVGGAMCTIVRSGEHIRMQLGTRTVHMTADEAYALVAAIEAAIG